MILGYIFLFYMVYIFLYLMTVYAHKSLRVHEPHPVYPSPPRDFDFLPLFLISSSSLFFSSLSSVDSHPHFILFFYPHILPLYLFCPGGGVASSQWVSYL